MCSYEGVEQKKRPEDFPSAAGTWPAALWEVISGGWDGNASLLLTLRSRYGARLGCAQRDATHSERNRRKEAYYGLAIDELAYPDNTAGKSRRATTAGLGVDY